MNTQSIEENRPEVTYGRKEYVRMARESCLVNYYGDKMQSRDKILKEIALKKKEEEDLIRKKQSNSDYKPVVIPFEEGKLRANRNQQTIDLREDRTRNSESGMAVQEPTSEMIPESADILKMSGIVETQEDRMMNDYVNEFANSYHNPEATNFLTSIRNAEPEQEDKKQKDTVEVKSFRVFVIRCVCSFLLLATVILLDNLKFSYKGYEAKSIYNKIVSTELMERVEDYFAALSSK